MMFFMNEPNMLRFIVTLFVIIFFKAHYIFIPLLSMISSQTSLQSHILHDNLAILSSNSSWSLALYLKFKFEGSW